MKNCSSEGFNSLAILDLPQVILPISTMLCLLSVHVMFDDSFELDDDIDRFVPNVFVRQLIECMEDAARYW